MPCFSSKGEYLPIEELSRRIMKKQAAIMENQWQVPLTEVGRYILETRHYLLRKDGVLETQELMMRRVAHAIAAPAAPFRSPTELKELEDSFFQMLCSLDFLPNTPTLANAGKPRGQLAACFVLPIEDSLDSIFQTMKNMAIIQQSGGGTGFSLSRLRPRGDRIGGTQAESTGPLSFMAIYNKTTEVVKQQGVRRGANMAVLSVDHTDILEFIDAKRGEKEFQNFNLYVGITDEFLEAIKQNRTFPLINPRNKKEVGRLAAKDVYDRIIQ